MKKIMVGLLVLVLLVGCSPGTQSPASDKTLVITTLFPQYDFARVIGGEEIDLRLLLPPGTEPHQFEPKPQDVASISEADVFLYTGDVMEPWVEGILSSAKPALVKDVSEGVTLLKTREDHDDHDHHEEEHDDHEEGHDDHDEEHGDHEEHAHDHGGVDPHIWTSLENARIMAKNVLDALVEADPAHEELFRSRWEAYDKELLALDEEYISVISELPNKTLLYGGHFAFGYLAERYGLTHRSPYAGYSTNAEPTPVEMAKLIDALKETHSTTLYFEELTDPRVAQAIADETGAQLVLLHGAHNLSPEEAEQGLTYMQIMKDNLDKLRKGLQ